MNTSTSFLTAHSTTTNNFRDIRINSKSLITAREKQVLNLIAYEYSSKEIASKLFVSYETVNSHRKNIMSKLGVKNTAGMVRVAFERRLLHLNCTID